MCLGVQIFIAPNTRNVVSLIFIYQFQLDFRVYPDAPRLEPLINGSKDQDGESNRDSDDDEDEENDEEPPSPKKKRVVLKRNFKCPSQEAKNTSDQ